MFLVATPIYLWLARPKTETTSRPWYQVWIFSPIAFFLWSMATTGPWATVETAGLIGGVGVVLASVLVFPLLSMAIARGSS